MSTPESIKDGKSTPCRSGGISKALLTPCRRPGLARKIKVTPKSQFQSPVNNPAAEPSLETCNTTPISTGNSTKAKLKRNNATNKSRVCIQMESDSVTDYAKKVEDIKENKPLTMEQNKDDTTKSNKEIISKKIQPELPKSSSDDGKQVNKSAVLELGLKQDTPLRGKDVLTNLNNKPHTSKTKLVKRLSMKKTPSYSQDESDIEDFQNTQETSLSSNLSQDFHNTEESAEELKIASSKSSRKRCIIYSSDEEDFVSIQKSKKIHNSQTESWETKIEEIKKRIKIKEARLADMKQAVIYKKLHDVDELKKLTAVWKNGCQDSLRHLLRKLQEHGPIEMSMLMNNLKIPPIITYNVEDDSFK